MTKQAKGTIVISLSVFITTGIIGFFANFFLTVFPESQAQVKVIDEKVCAIRSDIKDMKHMQEKIYDKIVEHIEKSNKKK